MRYDCDDACMTSKDPSYEARSILRQLKRSDAEERARKIETSLDWEAEAMERASTFVRRMSGGQVNLPLKPSAVI